MSGFFFFGLPASVLQGKGPARNVGKEVEREVYRSKI